METGNEALKVLCVIYRLNYFFQAGGMLGPEAGIPQWADDEAIAEEKLFVERRCTQVSFAYVLRLPRAG